MAQSVPERRVELTPLIGGARTLERTVGVSKSVRGDWTWARAAEQQCWLAGRGSMEVPAHSPMTIIPNQGGATFRYWIAPRFQTCRYAFSFVLRSASGSPGRAAIRIPSGGSAQTVITGTRTAPRAATLFADRSAQSTTEAELTFDIEDAEDDGIIVECIAVEAMPRSRLLVSSDLGADRATLRTRQPIMEPTLSAAVLDRQNDLLAACRRTGLFQFCRGIGHDDENFAFWASSSGTAADLFQAGIAVLSRRRYRPAVETRSDDVVTATKWRILARCSNDTTSGVLELSNSLGSAAYDIEIPTGTTDWTWLPAAGSATFACDVEDNTSDYGYPSDTPDLHTFALRRTAGAGTVEVATVSMNEVA